jgi:hypothetical protein
MSIMLLISSRIIFTSSDVNTSAKDAVSVVLIIALVLLVIRTVRSSLHKRMAHKKGIMITQGLIESLEQQDRSNVNQAVVDYFILHKKRVLEIDQNFAMSCTAASVFFGKSVQPVSSLAAMETAHGSGA